MNEHVREALQAAGWSENRRVDPSVWVTPLEREGFVMNASSRAILREYGGLVVRSRPGVKSDCFAFDPYDAASGLADEADELREIYGEIYSPVGMWSNQYVTYVADDARVIAIGPGWDWQLGESLEQALDLVVNGERQIICLRVQTPGGRPFP